VAVILYTLFVLATGLERLYELRISRTNARIATEQGGKEVGRDHFPWMVALHTGLLVGAIAEVWIFDRPFIVWLGVPMLIITLACQFGRYWIISTLGWQWNTRVIVVPGAPRNRRGPYRFQWLCHPNYWIVVVEGIALPMIHTAWITALAFTVLNAVLLLGFRIPTENEALRELA
jgi:methyltransferase|tara:strand:+ start:1217 stop:1741 length:525 start_codon:yes stop_codon:yes gene_type:complete